MSATGAVLETGGGVAGAAAGRVLFGAIGSLFGPVGTFVGQAVGAKVGAWAGRATGRALANAIDNANSQAEVQTKAVEAAKPCENCEIRCFKPKKGSTSEEVEEFKRQLQEQEDALNKMDPSDILNNMNNYARDAAEAALREATRDAWITNKITELLPQFLGGDRSLEEATRLAEEAARNQAKNLDVIHTPDLKAGGSGVISKHNGGLASSRANRSIGSQWNKGGRLKGLEEQAKQKRDGQRDRIELKLCEDEAKQDGNPQPKPGGKGNPLPGTDTLPPTS